MSGPRTLASALDGLDAGLARVLTAIAASCEKIAAALRCGSVAAVGSANSFGDKQLDIDCVADRICFDALRSCGAVSHASSEETTAVQAMGGAGFSVAFDPLDGSSVVQESFAVGSIFGVWPGPGLIGRSGREQTAAAYAVYGPRTALVIARPDSAGGPCVVSEFLLDSDSDSDSGKDSSPAAKWRWARDLRLGRDAQTFAPANLRASNSNPAYRALVESAMAQGLTLRYTGAMVPDVHHSLSKGQGLFINATSGDAPPKLRLLYEVAPLAFVVESAGGASLTAVPGGAAVSALDVTIQAVEDRAGVALGSAAAVEQSRPAIEAR